MSRELYSRNWDRMSFDEQGEYRDRKLSWFVRTQLYPYSPFYRKMFDDNGVKPADIRGVEDLRKLPFTYKADIAPTTKENLRPREFVLQPDEGLLEEYMPRFELARLKIDRVLRGPDYLKAYLWRKYGPVHIQFTTGRTGLPTPILYAADDVERMTEAGRRIFDLAGFGRDVPFEGAVLVNAMPFAPHLGFWMVAKGLDSSSVLSLHTGGGRVLGTQRIISAVESLGATGLIGMPGYIYHVLRTASDMKADFSSLKFILVAGERPPSGMDKRLTELLEGMGASDFHVLVTFGFTEARKSYSECASGGSETGFHLYPDLDYIELIDPETEKPVGEGEDGELVYTCLEGQGTCVIRFRTGDFVKGGMTYEPCPACGRTVPRLASDISRTGAVKGFQLTKIKGTLVDSGAYFTVLSENPGVREWQVEINKAGGDPYEVDVVDVFVAPAEGADREALRAELDAALEAATEVTPNRIEFLTMDEMLERMMTDSEMKELHVVDRRPD